MNKTALISGITGQDGSYLAEFLLYKGYEVHGIIRRSSSFHTGRIDHIYDKLHLHYGDITDYGNTAGLIQTIKPDEVYNLAAQTHVRVSFEMPEYTTSTIVLGNLNLLEAIRRTSKDIKFYQASSSEMFGSTPPPHNEKTEFRPRSPYGVAKLAAYWNTENYREGYDMLTYNGILFNHTSPRRGMTFVSRKITSFIAKMIASKGGQLQLGNLYGFRDFGFAPDFVKAMWMMMQGIPNDFVVGTGTAVEVKYFIKKAFDYAGFPIIFKGEGIKEIGVIFGKNPVISILPKYYRPTEVYYLQAEPYKVKALGWTPTLLVDGIIKVMVDYDMEKEGLTPIGEGKKIIKNNDYQWTSMR